MEAIQQLFDLDFTSAFISIFVILAGIKSVLSIIEWLIDKMGLETKWMLKKKTDRRLLMQTSNDLCSLQKKHDESVKQSIRHDEIIKKEIVTLTDTVNQIVKTLEAMQQKENETELKKLKDSLIRYYNKYKITGQWSKLEKEAFWDLFEDYEARGGNGYIHSIIEPAMRELEEID